MGFLQGAHNAGSGSVNNIAATFSVAVGSGNAVVGIVSFGTGTLNSVTDDKGNTYNRETTINDGVNSQNAASFSLGNITNAPTTVTANFSAGVGARSIAVAEYSGISAVADPRDGHGGQLQPSPGTGTNGLTSGSGNCVTTIDGDTIVGLTADSGGSAVISHGTSFSAIRVTDTTAGCAGLNIEDLTQGAHSATTVATFTQNANDAGLTWAIALKAAAGGGDTLMPMICM